MAPLSLCLWGLSACLSGIILGWCIDSLAQNFARILLKSSSTKLFERFAILRFANEASNETQKGTVWDQKAHGLTVPDVSNGDGQNYEEAKRTVGPKIYSRGSLEENKANHWVHEFVENDTDEAEENSKTKDLQKQAHTQTTEIIHPEVENLNADHRADSKHEEGSIRGGFDSKIHTEKRSGTGRRHTQFATVPDPVRGGQKFYKKELEGRN